MIKQNYFLWTTALCLCVLLFTQCSKDFSVAGKTYFVSEETATNCNDVNDNVSLTFGSDGCVTENSFSICAKLVFGENGEVTSFSEVTAFGQTETDETKGTYTLSGNSITICFNGDCSEGTVNENELIGNYTDSTDGCEVHFVYKR